MATITGMPGIARAQVVTNITTDGRTQTQVATSGSVTNITTATFSGGNALNSFSTFDVGTGSTVNLVVPDQARALVNIVRDRAVTIEGIVNSVQHGTIGGNVFFADPHGFVVGKAGVVNVGSLTVATPTAAFLDTVLNARGGIGTEALTSLLAGDLPLSADGTIAIHGAVRAANGIRLQGQTVVSRGIVTAGLAGHDALFAASVNTDAMAEGARLVERNGRIEILAAGEVELGGTLMTTPGSTAPAIEVRAASDIRVAAGTQLRADAGAAGNGGVINLLAGRDLTVADGLTISARGGSERGDGGAVELSAKRQETLGAASYDLGAVQGATGTLLFDPAVLEIVQSQATHGAAYTMLADERLHLAAGVKIDTTNGTGQSGAISLTAPNIVLDGTLNAGTGATAGNVTITAERTSALASTIYGTTGNARVSITQGSGSAISGKQVSIAATASSTADQGLVSAGASISIAGTITGTSVAITADAAATTHENAALGEVVTDGVQAAALFSGIPFLQDAANAIGSTQLPLNSIGYVKASADAGVSVLSGATITGGTGGVLLRSTAAQTIDRAKSNGVGLGVVVAKIDGGATTDVASGATITSGGNLKIGAHDAASSTLPIAVASSLGAPDITVAVLKADIAAESTVHSGATLSAAGDLAIVGRNDTNYDTQAQATAAADGSVGIAAALAFTSARATAILGASVGSATSAPVNVLVEADSVGANSIVRSESKTGGRGSSQLFGITDWSSLTDQLQGVLLDRYLGGLMGSASSTPTPKLNSALAVNDSTTVTKAVIAPIDGATTAPTVLSSGSVAVVANRVDGGVATSGSSNVSSRATKGGISYSVSAGVAVGVRNDTTLALIAPQAVVTSGTVAVQANLALPRPYIWSSPLLRGKVDFDAGSAGDVKTSIGDLFDALKDLTDPESYATGYAAANGGGQTGSLGGAVNYLARTGSTTAWVGAGASVTATATSGSAGWNVLADGGDARLMPDAATVAAQIPYGAHALAGAGAGGALPTLQFGKSLTVSATSDATTLFIAGDLSSISSASGSAAGGGSGSSTSGAVGGVVSMYDVTTSTIAGIAGGATVRSSGELAVSADSTNQTYVVAPGAGTGGTIGVTGIVLLSNVADRTHASIASSATISAPVVSVLASEGVNLWTASGALSTGKGLGVGVSVSINHVDTDTSATVGDNSADAVVASAADAAAGGSSNSVRGSVSANALNVHAGTYGRAGAISLALAKAGDSGPGPLSRLVDGAKGAYKAVSDGVDAVRTKLDPLLNPLSALLDKAAGAAVDGGKTQSVSASAAPDPNSAGKAATTAAKNGFALGVAGAASVGLYDAKTRAGIANVQLDPFTGGQAIAIDVLATRSASFFTLAGGLSWASNKANAGSSSASVGGAVALTEDSGDTLASVVSVSASKAGTTQIQALTGGQTVAVGLGAAVSSDKSGGGGSASGTLSLLHGATNADLAFSTLSGVGAADLRVRAYNSSQIALGGGGFSAGANAAVGASITLSLLEDSSRTDPVTGQAARFVSANVVGTQASFAHIGVVAEAPVRLINAALSGGLADDSQGTALALGAAYGDIGRTIAATVSASALTATATDSDAAACTDEQCGILVLAGAERSAALEAVIGTPRTVDSDVDFSAPSRSSAFGTAANGASILSAAGAFQRGGNAAGLEFAGGNIHDSYRATVVASSLTASNSDIAVLTRDTAYIGALAVGGSVASGNSGISFLGSSTVNLVSNSDQASVTGAGSAISAKAVTISAAATAGIDSLAGNVVVGKTALGAAVGFNQINRTIAAEVTGFEVNATILNVTSEASGRIRTASVGGAVAQGAGPAITGSFTINRLADTISARIGSGTLVSGSSGYTTVAARNSGRIDALAGSFASAGTGLAAGVAVAVNLLSGATTAEVSGATIRSADLDVIGKASGSIGVIAVGAGLGGSTGIGGSIATNILSNTTSALLSTSTVTAANSVSLQASNANGVQVSSGAVGDGDAAGVGLGVATNILGASTSALIDGGSVTAGGAGTGRVVNAGTLTTPLDTSALMCLEPGCDHDNDARTYSTLFIARKGDATDPVNQMAALTYDTRTVKGLSVNAITSQNVAVLSAAISGSDSAAVSADIGTSVVSGTTRASIANASIQTGSGAHGAVDVRASGTTLIGNIIAGVAGASNFAGAGAVAAAKFQQTVRADVTGSTIGANGAPAGAVSIAAMAQQQSFGISAGAALGGSLAFAGSGLVNLFSSDTTAQLIGGTVTASSLAVNANTMDAVGGATGAIAAGFGAGAGAGAFNIAQMRDRTIASIGSDAVGTATNLKLTGDLTVRAEGRNRFAGLAVSGAGGAYVGISGLANVLTVESGARAGIYNATLGNGAGQVQVSSLVETRMRGAGGALGVGLGGVGLGLALNIAIVKDASVAEVVGSTLNATSVAVTADKMRALTATTVSGGGGFVGAGGAVNLYLIGALGTDGLKDDSGDLGSASDLQAMISHADALASSDLSGNNSSLSTTQRSSGSTAAATTAAATLNGTAQASTTARIANSTVTASSVTTTGTVQSSTFARVGAGGIGAVGVGGAVGFTRVRDSVWAGVEGTSTVTAPTVTIAAVTRDGSDGASAAVDAYAGAAGVVGIGASVASIDIRNELTASVAGTIASGSDGASSIGIRAEDATTQSANGLGAAAGAGAAGLSAGSVVRKSAITAQIDANARVGGYRTVSIDARDTGSAAARSIAAAGGIVFGGSGAVAVAIDSSDVKAQINTDALSNVADAMTISATGTTGLSASADGGSLGAVGVGASVATATASQKVSALDNGNAHGGAGSLTIQASLATAGAISATARAAAGGILAGVQAASANATNAAQVVAELNKNDTDQAYTGHMRLVNGDIAVLATNNNQVTSDAQGVVAGLYAAGAVVSTATASSTTRAAIGASTETATQVRSGDVTVRATGVDTTTAYALSGSGGMIAGAAATALTRNQATTDAVIGARGISGRKIVVAADHMAKYAGAADAHQAAEVGASGAIVDNLVSATTRATIENNAGLTATDVRITANNSFANAALPHDAGIAGVGGAGGLANVGAVSVTSTISGTANTKIGDGVQIYVVGDPIALLSSGSDNGLYIDATTSAATSDGAKLELAGAFEGPFAAANVTGTYVNQVDIGTGGSGVAKTLLYSDGALGIGAQSVAQQAAAANVSIYGLAGAGGGRSNATVTSSQLVNLAGNADLLSYGQMRVGAGVRSDGATENAIASDASTRVYNNTAVPITAILDANASSNSVNTLTIGGGARLRSVLDVALTSTQGTVKANGDYVGTNPYLTLFSSDKTGGNSNKQGTGDLLLGGQVVAGVANEQSLTVSGVTVTGRSSLDDDQSPTRYFPFGQYVGKNAAGAFTPLDDIAARIALLQNRRNGLDANGAALAQRPSAEDISAIDGEITLLRALSSDLSAMGAANGIATVQTGSIYAAGGDIKIRAERFDKLANTAPSLTAKGDAKVTITNPTGASLLVGQVYLPTSGTGAIKYLGAATGPASAITTSQSSTGKYPTLLVQNTSDSAAPGSTGAGTSIFLNGAIYNPTGTTTISNLSGSIAQFAPITTAQLVMNAPNGSFFVNQAGIWNMVDPASQWSTLPVTAYHKADGSVDTSRSTGNAFGVVDYAVNYLYNNDGALDTSWLARKLIGDGINNVLAVGQLPNNRDDGDDSGYTVGVGGDIPYRIGGSGDNQYMHYYGPYGNNGWWLLFSAPLAVKTSVSAAASSQGTSGVADSSIDVGRSVTINAGTININGSITAGKPTTQSVTLDASAQAYINAYRADPNNSRFTVVNGLLSLDAFTGTGAGAIRAAYDTRGQITQNGVTIANPNAGKIVLANVDASGGGAITLNGQIINTDGKGLGNLTVRSGYGQVSINNYTNTPLVVADIATGSGEQNGIIKITDRSFRNAQGGALTRWWVNPQGTDQVLQYSNVVSGTSDLASAQLVSTGSGRTSSYQPGQNLRYAWDDYYTATRNVYRVGDWWTDWQATAWRLQGSNNQDFTRGAAYVTSGNSNDPAFSSRITSASLGNNYYEYVGWHHYMYERGGDLTVATYIAPQLAQVTVTNSIKADNPIGIRFVGNLNASVSIRSTPDVYLAGTISDAKGNLSVVSSNGAIFGGAGALTANDYNFSAATGIGSATQAVTMASAGSVAPALYANTRAGNINLVNTTGGLAVSQVRAVQGDVTLAAAGTIRGASGGSTSQIIGNTLRLTSTDGAIGEQATPITIQARTVNAEAANNIYLTQSSGNLVAGSIVSHLGQIFLAANNGTVVAGTVAAEAAADKAARDRAVWDALGLTATDAGETAVVRYQNAVDSAYARFWSVKNALDPNSGNTRLSAAGIALFRPQAAALLGVSDPASLSDSAINTAILGAMQAARDTLTSAAVDSSLLDTRSPTFRFVLAASDPRYQALVQGAKWTDSQLTNTIGGGKTTASGTNLQAQSGISIRANNAPATPQQLTVNVRVSGRTTSYFVATGPGSGYFASDSDTDSSHYTASQIRGLLAANGDNAAKTQLSADEVQFTLATQATVSARTQSGTTNVTSTSDFHLAMDGDVSLGQLSSAVTGTLYVEARGGNIVNGDTSHVSTVGGLSLTASGYAGTEANPLLFNAADPTAPLRILNITAGGGVAVQVRNAGIALGDVSFTGTASITAAGSISSYGGADGATSITGGGGLLTLRAAGANGGAIGTSVSPFVADVTDRTALALFAGSASLSAPAVSGRKGDLVLATSTLANGLAVNAAGAVDWRSTDTGAITASTVSLRAGDGIGATAAIRLITPNAAIESTGLGAGPGADDVAVTFLNAATTGVSLSRLQAANGALRILSSSGLALGGVSADGDVSIRTTSGDLTATTVASERGSITLHGAGAVQANSFTARAGAVDATAANDLSIGTAISGTSLSLRSTAGAVRATYQLNAGSDLTVDAVGAISGGAEIDAAGSARLRGQSIVLGYVDTGARFDAATPGALTLANGRAQGFTLAGASVTYGNLVAGSLASTISATGLISGGSLTSGAAIALSGGTLSAQGLSGTSVTGTITGQATVNTLSGSGDVTFRADRLVSDTVTAGGTLQLTTAGLLSLGTGSGRDVALSAGAAAAFTGLTASAGLGLQAGGDITGGQVQAGAIALRGGTIALTTLRGTGAQVIANGRFTANEFTTSGDASITAAGITLGFPAPTNGGGAGSGSGIGDGGAGGGTSTVFAPISAAALTLTSRDSILLGGTARVTSFRATATGDLDFTGQVLRSTGAITLAGGGRIVGSGINTTGAVDLAGRSLTLDALAAGSVNATGDTTLVLRTLATTGDAGLTSNGTISLTSGDVGGMLRAAVNGAGAVTLGLGTVTAGQGMALASAGDLSFTTLTGGGAFAATAMGSISGQSLTGFSSVSLTGGSLALRTLQAGTIGMTTIGMSAVTALTSIGDASVRGGGVSLGTVDVGGLLTVTTTGGVLSLDTTRAAAMTLASAGDLSFTTLAGTGAFTATATGAISGQGLTGFTTAQLTGASLALVTLQGGALGVTTTGAMAITSLTSSGDASLRGGSLSIGTADIGSQFAATTTGGVLSLGTTRAAAMTLASAGDLSFTTLAGTGTFTATATGAINGQRLTGFTTAQLTGASLALGTLQGGVLGATTTGAAAITSLTSSGDAALRGGSLSIGTADIGGQLTATTTGGALSLDTTRAAAMTLTSAGDLSFMTLAGTGAFTATATGAINGQRLTGFTTAQLTGASLALGTLQGGVLGATTTGATAITSLTSSGDAALRGGSLSIGSGDIGGQLTATTTGGALSLDTARAAAMRLASAGDLSFTTLAGTGAFTATGAGAINGQRLTGFTMAQLTGASLALGTLQGGALGATTTGATAITSLTSSGDAALLGGSLSIGTADVGGQLTATTTGGALSLDTARAAAMTLASAGDLSFTTLAGTDAFTATATGAINGQGLTGFSNAQLTGASLALGTLQGGVLGATTTGASAITSLTSSGDAALRGGSLSIGTADVGGQLTATTTAGVLSLGTTRAAAMTLASAGDLSFTTLAGTGAFTATAIGAISGQGLTGFSNAQLTGASLALGTLQGGVLGVTTTGATAITSLTSSGDTSLRGGSLSIGTAEIGGQLTATTTAGALSLDTARAAAMTLASAGDLSFTTLAGTGAFTAAATGAISGQRLTGFTTAQLTGASLALGTLQGGVLGATTTGTAAITSLTSSGDAALRGGSLSIGSADVGGQLTATTTGGALSLDTARAAAMTLASAGDLSFTTLVGTGAFTATATGAMNGQGLTGFSTVQLTGASLALATVQGDAVATSSRGATTVTSLIAGSRGANLQADVLRVDQLAAVGSVAMSGTGITLGTLRSEAGLTVRATGDLVAGTLQAARIALDVSGQGRIDSARATSDLIFTGGNLVGGRLTTGGALDVRGGALVLDTLDAGTVAIRGTGPVTLQQSQSRGLTQLTATGDLRATRIQSGGDVRASGATVQLDSVTANGVVQLAASGRMSLGSVTASLPTLAASAGLQALAAAASGIDLTAGDRIDATSLTSAGSLFVDAAAISLATASSAGDLTLHAIADATLGNGRSGGALNLAADKGSVRSDQLAAGGGLMLVSGGSASVKALTAASSATLRAGGDILLGDLTSGAATALAAGGAITSQTLVSGSALAIAATGDVRTGTIRAATDLSLAGRDLQLGTVDAASMQAVGGGALAAQRISIVGDARITARDNAATTVSIDALQAATASIAASGSGANVVRLGNAAIGQRLEVNAASLQASVNGTGSALQLSLTGVGTAPMDAAQLNIGSSVPLAITRLAARTATVQAASPSVSIADASAELFTLTTPAVSVQVGTAVPQLPYRHAVQYLTLDGRFAMDIAERSLLASAPAIWADPLAGIALSGSAGTTTVTTAAAIMVEDETRQRRRIVLRRPIAAVPSAPLDPVAASRGGAVNTSR